MPSFNRLPIAADDSSGFIAYGQTNHLSASLGIVYIHGYMSSMSTPKADYLARFCNANGIDFLRFDLQGHGESSESFLNCTFDIWLSNVLHVLDTLTDKPQILVGSSLGAWLMLRCYSLRKTRICGMLGLAPAVDFTSLLSDRLSGVTDSLLTPLDALSLGGTTFAPIFSKEFIATSAQHYIYTQPYEASIPIRLLYGMDDTVITFEDVQRLFYYLQCDNIALNLLRHSSHRLSDDHALLTMAHQILELIAQHKASLL